MVVILSKLFSHAELFMSFLIPPLFHILDGQHVANVANLNADVCELGGNKGGGQV